MDALLARPPRLDAARAAHFKTRRQYRPGFRFVERYTSLDGIEFYAWERPVPGDSRVERITTPVSWFWGGGTTFWKGRS